MRRLPIATKRETLSVIPNAGVKTRLWEQKTGCGLMTGTVLLARFCSQSLSVRRADPSVGISSPQRTVKWSREKG